MLAASIDGLAAANSADAGQMGSNTLAAGLFKTLQGIENAELNLLAQTSFGRIIDWAVSRFDQIVTAAANAFDTMIEGLLPHFNDTQGTPAVHFASTPQPPPAAPIHTSSPPNGGIRPLVEPAGSGGSGSPPPVANNDSYSLSHDTTFSVDATYGVLANDTDPNGLSLSAVLVTGPSDGTLTLNSNGSFLYTPKAGWTGSDAFQYYATDGQNNSNTTTVTFTVQNSGAITTQASNYSVAHDRVLSVDAGSGVLANDSDSDGDGLTASLVSGPSNGSLQLNTDGSFNYTPNSGYSGNDSFRYTAGDGAQNSAPTTVSISVTNTTPIAINHTYGIPENTAENVTAVNGLLDGSSDSDGDYVALSSWTQPSDGTLQVNPDGSFSYTPKSNYTGSDSFQYTVSDGAATANATVTLNVHSSNTAPAANADSYNVERNNVFTADPSIGVLVNDSDANGDPLSAILATGPSHGTLTLNTDGSFDYTPNTNFTGTDKFTYKAGDGVADSTAATVTLTVNASAPTAADQAFAVKENTTLNALAGTLMLNASNPDYMALTAKDVTQPSHGTVTVNANGSFVYTPTTGFTGTDSFTYDLTDGSLTSSAATFTIYVNASDTAPTAANLSYSVNANDSLSNDASNGVLPGASDSDGDALVAKLVSGPSHGTLTLNLDGSFTYTPNTNFIGSDSFQYEAFDGSGYSNAATVTITVNSNVPTANNDTYGVHPNIVLNVSGPGVLANDSDADSLQLSATLVSGVSHGSLTLNTDGSFSYTPNSGFTGTDSFTYEAGNDIDNSNVATVTLNVHSTNSVPTANSDSYSTTANAPLTMLAASGALANDSDPDKDTLTAQLVSSTSHGSLTLNSDGSFTYTPNNDFIGTDSFMYRANDGLSNSNTATVTISVTDTAPSAADQSYTISHDQILTVNASAQTMAKDPSNESSLVSVKLGSVQSNGKLQFSGNGGITYTPDPHFVGTDSFTYETNDGILNSAPATVYVTVTNAAPIAADDYYSTTSGNGLSVAASSGVLTNDDDLDGDTMTAQLVTGPSHGTLTLSSDGSFTYNPNFMFSGNDSFTYEASDGVASSNTATVTITVMSASATAPVANNDLFATGMNQALTTPAPGVLWNAVAPAGKTLTAVLHTGPADGTLTLNSDGSFTYTPNTGFTGADSFTYYASANGVQSASAATVTIEVGGIGFGTHVQWVPINANDDNGSTITNMIPELRDFGSLKALNQNDQQLLPLAITIKNPLPFGYVQLLIEPTGTGTGRIRLWRSPKKGWNNLLQPGIYPTSGPNALPSTIYVEGVNPTSRTISGNSVQQPPSPDTNVIVNYWVVFPWWIAYHHLGLMSLGEDRVSVGVTPVVQFFTINNQPSPPNPAIGPPEAGLITFGPNDGPLPNTIYQGYQTFGVNPIIGIPNGQNAATFRANVYRANATGALHFVQNMTISNGFSGNGNAWIFGDPGPASEKYVWKVNGGLQAPNTPLLDIGENDPPPYSPLFSDLNLGSYEQITSGDSPSANFPYLVKIGLQNRDQQPAVTAVFWTFNFTKYLIWSMPAGGTAPGDIIYTLATRPWSVALFAMASKKNGWADTILNPNKLSGVLTPGDFTPSHNNPVVSGTSVLDATKISAKQV